MIGYDVYYDECKENGYWHGILFVPAETNHRLISLLDEARCECRFRHRLHFVDIGANDPTDSPRTRLTGSYISIGCASLQQQKFEKYRPKAKVGHNPRIIEPIAAKFAAYRVVLRIKEVNNETREKVISETLKSALKGALHYLFDGAHDIGINRIFFEGEGSSSISDKKIICWLKEQARDHIKNIPDHFIFQTSDHTKLDKTKNIGDSYILQLCDSLIGAIRFSVACSNSANNSRKIVSLPIQEILEYSKESHARMKESRYYRGFSLVQAEKDSRGWTFSKLQLPQREVGVKQVEFNWGNE